MKKWIMSSVLGLGLLQSPSRVEAMEPASLVGTWAVTMTIESTSCAANNIGDMKAIQFMVSYTDGKYKVQTVGPEDTSFDYEGVLQNGGTTLAFQGAKRNASAVVWARESKPGVLSGTRLVANPAGSTAGSTNACAIVYRIEMKKI